MDPARTDPGDKAPAPAQEAAPQAGTQESDLARNWRQWAVTRLVPVVVHRANNAIGAQLGAADLVARHPGDSEKHLQTLHEGAQELGELMGALSRLAKEPPRTGEAELGEVLRGSERLLAPLVHEKCGRLTIDGPHAAIVVGLPAWRLEQVVVALATSALIDSEPRGAGEGPRCRIRCVARERRLVALYVTVDRPLPSAPGGADLGALLETLSHEFAAHGCRFRLRSGPNSCGASWVAPTNADIVDTAMPRAHAVRRRMLVYLAEPMLAELTKAVLAECNIDAELAADPEEFATKVSENEWSLCLLEPRGASTEVLERCREHAAHVAILSSGQAPDGDWHGVLPMPFRPKDLIRFVGESESD